MSKLELNLSKNSKASFDIDDRITFIGGDSGTGKTFTIDALIDAVKNPDISNIKKSILDRIIVCKDEENLQSIRGCSGKIIFLDRYDIFSEKAKAIMQEEMIRRDNTWIIMTRRPDFTINCGFSSNSYKTLKTYTNDNGVQVIETVDA